MKIILFGATGMLGNYVRKILSEKLDVICIYREDFDILNDNWDKLNTLLTNLNKTDVIVNCAGIIPQTSDENEYKKYIKINTLFPHKLQDIADKFNSKLIHISTNCVFKGNDGYYSESHKPNNDNIYGVTKSLGEIKNATVIRTSIIGHENFGEKKFVRMDNIKKKFIN